MDIPNPFIAAQAPAIPHMNPNENLMRARYMLSSDMAAMREAQYAQQQQRQQGGGRMAPMGTSVSSFLDPAFQHAANALLAPYGLSEPTSTQPNVFLPNSGFFGNHPRLSAAIEGGVLAGANAPQAATWGQGIQSVLQGILGGRQEKASLQAAPFMAPLDAASRLEQLRDMSDKHQLNEAMINWHRAQADKAEREPVPKYIDHRVDAMGKLHGITADGQDHILSDANYNPPNVHQKKAPAQLAQYLAANGIDEEDATPADYAKAHGQWLNDQMALRKAGAQVAAGAASTRQGRSQKFQTLKGQLIKPNDKNARNAIRSQLMLSKQYQNENQVEEEVVRRNQAIFDQMDQDTGDDSGSPMPSAKPVPTTSAPSPQPVAKNPYR